MFIGHFAVGFASKRWAPQTPLSFLIAAPILLDLLWPIFLLLGIEEVKIDPGNTRFTPFDFVSYPYSHSLVAAVCWAVLFSVLYGIIRRDRPGMVAITIGVLSHWLLDFVTHRPDMPLFIDNSVRVGLGLWNYPAATIFVESTMFVAAIWLYSRATHPRDGAGKYGFAAFVVFLLISYAGSILGPPPPNTDILAKASLSLWLLPFWAGWFDRHREPAL